MTTGRDVDTGRKFSLRLKENVLLVLTALVMCWVYEVCHDGEMPWAEGMGAFVLSWLGSYGILVFLLLLVIGSSATTDKLFFGGRPLGTRDEPRHRVAVYACITILVSSLCVFVLWGL